jgi:hypothetical protein
VQTVWLCSGDITVFMRCKVVEIVDYVARMTVS